MWGDLEMLGLWEGFFRAPYLEDGYNTLSDVSLLFDELRT